MTRNFPALDAQRSNAAVAARLRKAERVCVAAAAGIAAAAVARQIAPGLEGVLSWALLPLPIALAGLASAASLEFSLREKMRGSAMVSIALAAVAAICAIRSLTVEVHRALQVQGGAGSMPVLVTLAFLVLAIVLVLLPIKAGLAGYAPDAALFGAGWVVVGLVLGKALGAIHAFGMAVPTGVKPATIVVLALLTFVTFGRRAEHGHFSIFLNRGVGGRIARMLLPIVLLLPALREAVRSRAIRWPWLPEHYAAGILASFGTMVALLLVMIVARQFRRLEARIQDLSLRDELTGLYNLRGFQILAEQALRLSHRSQVPFSILFVDVDDLKQINDREGHGTGSKLLVEAAEFLTEHFRETDIVARIGGDEFVVAGHFTPDAIELAELRLRADSEDDHRGARLSLSMGHATSDPRRPEPLQKLLDRADAAMYERKRLKKLLAV
jgi:diguanylate cyclase (GGDEF)-like protein